MKCPPCNGSGLIDSYTVCQTCSGVGHDGMEMAVVEAKVETKPAKKRVSKIKKK